ncbi:hypothetical protein GW17_00018019 [Ensete ventricosum]|nr:hypothetical protein GW17_00018019 [Ensete ventricosum]
MTSGQHFQDGRISASIHEHLRTAPVGYLNGVAEHDDGGAVASHVLLLDRLSARSSATTADCRDGEFPQTDGDDVCVHAGDSCSWHDGLCYAFDPLHLKFAAEVITSLTSFTACGLLHISTVFSS